MNNGIINAAPSGQPAATSAFEWAAPAANLSSRDPQGEELLLLPSTSPSHSPSSSPSTRDSNAIGIDAVDGLRQPPSSARALFAPPPYEPQPSVLKPMSMPSASSDRPPHSASNAIVGLALSSPPFPFASINAGAAGGAATASAAGAADSAHSKRKLSRLYERIKDKFKYQRIRLKPKQRRSSGGAALSKARDQRRSSTGECLTGTTESAEEEEEVSASASASAPATATTTPQRSNGHANGNLSPSEADALRHLDLVVDSLGFGAEPSPTGAAPVPTPEHVFTRHHNASKSSFSSTLRASCSSQKHQQLEQSHTAPPAHQKRRSKSLLVRSAHLLFASSSARQKRALSQSVSDESRGDGGAGSNKLRGVKGVKAQRSSISPDRSTHRTASSLEVPSTWPKCQKYLQQQEQPPQPQPEERHDVNLVERVRQRDECGALADTWAVTSPGRQAFRPSSTARRRPPIPSEYITPRPVDAEAREVHQQQSAPSFQEPQADVPQYLPPSQLYYQQQQQRTHPPQSTMLPPEARHYATVRCVPRWPPVTPPTHSAAWFAPVSAPGPGPGPSSAPPHASLCTPYAPLLPAVPPVGWGEQLVRDAPEYFISSALANALGDAPDCRQNESEPDSNPNPNGGGSDRFRFPDAGDEQLLQSRYRPASGPAHSHSQSSYSYAGHLEQQGLGLSSSAALSPNSSTSAKSATANANLADRMSPDERVNFPSAHAVSESRSRASLTCSPPSTARAGYASAGPLPPAGRCPTVYSSRYVLINSNTS